MNNILPEDKLNRYVFIMWFMLSTLALGFSGIYAILPIILRAPMLANLVQFKDFFKVSLIVHVNLAVLVWFLSSSAMLMTSVTKKEFAPAAVSAFFASMIGSIFIIAAPFVGFSEPVLNNYVPILHNLAFILGISLFFGGIILQVLLTLASSSQIKGDVIRFMSYMSAMIFVIALLCFTKSVSEMKLLAAKRFIDLHEYYELLFWGAGHILQFNYVQLIIIVWLAIIGKAVYDPYKKFFFALQYLNFMLIISVLPVYWLYPIDSAELYNFFTQHMKHTGGIIVAVTAIWVGYQLLKQNSATAIAIYLASLILILSGGIIGYLISGMNVTIPAHYHGVIIGITVGLMGLFYQLLPIMGFSKVGNKKAITQMMLSCLGQLIHIYGLAMSGGYGALRKTLGGNLSEQAQFYMNIMMAGGGISLIGGMMFVVLILLSIKRGSNLNE